MREGAARDASTVDSPQREILGYFDPSRKVL